MGGASGSRRRVLRATAKNFISSLFSSKEYFFGELLSACSCMHQMAFELPRCLSNAFSA